MKANKISCIAVEVNTAKVNIASCTAVDLTYLQCENSSSSSALQEADVKMKVISALLLVLVVVGYVSALPSHLGEEQHETKKKGKCGSIVGCWTDRWLAQQ